MDGSHMGIRFRSRRLGAGNIFALLYDILRMIKENETVLEGTPKTLSVKESLYLERIGKDFPEFNLDLARSYVNETVTMYLQCLKDGNTEELEKNCTENFAAQAASRQNGMICQDIKFHRTVVSDYRVLRAETGKRDAVEARITFQTACQYTIERGKRKKRSQIIQTRFELQYSYYLKDTDGGVSEVLRCSYCGAPVEQVGAKVCKYCGNGVVDTMKRTWRFSDIREF